MSIYADHQRRVFVLVIAGVPVRYHSGPSPALHLGGSVSSVASVPYTDVPALLSVSQYSSRLDPIGGVATYDPITITMAMDRHGGLTDPSVIFGRLGRRATGVQSTQLRASVLHQTTAPFDLQLEGTGNFPGNPDLVHIGAETMVKSSSVSHGTWEEVRIIERGAGGSAIQNHVINEIGLIPEATSDVTNWRSRRATLYAANLYSDGSTSSYTEIMRGFLDTTPRVDSPLSISVDLVPITAMLDNRIASDRGYKTELKHGYHYFTSDRGCVIEHSQGSVSSDLPTFPTISGQISAYNAGTGETTLVGGHNHNQYFDINLEDRHPRTGRFLGFDDPDAAQAPTGYSPGAPPYTGYFFPVGLFNPQVGQSLSGMGAQEIQRYRVMELGAVPAALEWPGVLNSYNTAQPIAHTGVAGSWLKLAFTGLNTPEPAIHARWNTTVPIIGGGFGLTFWTSSVSANREIRDGAGLPPMSWNPIGGPWPATTTDQLLTYAIDWASPDDDHYPRDWQDDQNGQTQRVYRYPVPEGAGLKRRIRAIARAYYRLGESYVLVRDPLILPTVTDPTSIYYLQVNYYDRAEQTQRTRMIRAFNQNPVTFGGAVVGYAIQVDPFALPRGHRVGSFGDWPNAPKTEISLGSYLDGLSPGGLILRLLLSGGGGGVNDATYDVLSYGAGLSSDDVDTPSIEAITAPEGLDLWRIAMPSDGLTVREAIDPILRALGYALVMRRTADGKCVLGAVAIGAEYGDTSAGIIGDGDWLADDPPQWGSDDQIVNSIEISADYDTESEKYRSRTTINDQRSIGSLSGEVRVLPLELPGLELRRADWADAASTLALFRPLFSRIFNLYGAPTRTFRGSVGTGRGLRGEVGTVYAVSSPHLRDYSDGWGVSNVRALVRGSTIDLMGEGAQLDLVYYGTLGAGFNASAKITSIDSPSSVIVAANEFSDRSPTGDSVKDVQGFAAGDKVDHLPVGDHDGRASHTIQSVDVAANRIVFTANHGIAVAGGTIEPPIYDDASTPRQAQAYLSDSSGELGAANTEGFDYL